MFALSSITYSSILITGSVLVTWGLAGIIIIGTIYMLNINNTNISNNTTSNHTNIKNADLTIKSIDSIKNVIAGTEEYKKELKNDTIIIAESSSNVKLIGNNLDNKLNKTGNNNFTYLITSNDILIATTIKPTTIVESTIEPIITTKSIIKSSTNPNPITESIIKSTTSKPIKTTSKAIRTTTKATTTKLIRTTTKATRSTTKPARSTTKPIKPTTIKLTTTKLITTKPTTTTKSTTTIKPTTTTKPTTIKLTTSKPITTKPTTTKPTTTTIKSFAFKPVYDKQNSNTRLKTYYHELNKRIEWISNPCIKEFTTFPAVRKRIDYRCNEQDFSYALEDHIQAQYYDSIKTPLAYNCSDKHYNKYDKMNVMI